MSAVQLYWGYCCDKMADTVTILNLTYVTCITCKTIIDRFSIFSMLTINKRKVVYCEFSHKRTQTIDCHNNHFYYQFLLSLNMHTKFHSMKKRKFLFVSFFNTARENLKLLKITFQVDQIYFFFFYLPLN